MQPGQRGCTRSHLVRLSALDSSIFSTSQYESDGARDVRVTRVDVVVRLIAASRT